MKKVLSLLAVSALIASSALMGADTKKKYTAGSCCDKAQKAGKVCPHPCCVEAEKKGEVCKKCNS